MEEASVAPTLNKEYFNNAYCGMDDWVYEMRREIQEIVPGVYLGPFSACRQVQYLKEKGITHITCFVDLDEAKLFRTETMAAYFNYQQLIVSDSNLQNLIQYFPSTSEYIRNVLANHGKVVVCCNGGMSRSPTFVIAYVMETFNIDASQAYHFEYEPIYKARQSNTAIGMNEDHTGQQINRRRRRSVPDDDTNSNYQLQDSKRLSRLEDQAPQQNLNAGYISMLL
ncbi:hypothetical protein INT48_004142 [Thamnidium elegans]|uniref:Uncharacterized protein n=1 Tax=Thamnidium elegans TaxID=101142 RepID=A0A8H7SQ00_9FUNG|nr:hypothetical protein INT48_004142 [Thamnidium elegans]